MAFNEVDQQHIYQIYFEYRNIIKIRSFKWNEKEIVYRRMYTIQLDINMFAYRTYESEGIFIKI